VNHPNAGDLIFFPAKEGATAEEIVDEALSYRPIGLVNKVTFKATEARSWRRGLGRD